MAKSRRFPWGLTVAVVPVLALLIGLGVWQSQRLVWKTALIQRLETARAAEPVSLDAALAQAAGVDVEHRRIVADCPLAAAGATAELTAIVQGRPGIRLLSPCRSGPPGPAVILDRGFLADADDPMGATRAPVPPPVATRVTGLLRRGEPANWLTPQADRDGSVPLFYARQPEIAAALGLAGQGQPWFVMAETSTNPDWPDLQPIAQPPTLANNHLGYAATWFGLALVLVGLYAAMVARALRAPGRTGA